MTQALPRPSFLPLLATAACCALLSSAAWASDKEATAPTGPMDAGVAAPPLDDAGVPAPAPAAPVERAATPDAPFVKLPERAQESRHIDLERLYSDDKPEEGLKQTEARLKQHPNDPELHLLLARFLYEIGERKKRDSDFDKEGLYERMVHHMERAQELVPGDPRIGWGLGLAHARLATTRGILSSLKSATRIESLWLAAAQKEAKYVSLQREEELPCDAFLSLGIFYRMLPDWWLVKLLAGTRGDLDKALVWLDKANTCSPKKIRVMKELGVAQLCAGKKKNDDKLIAQGKATLTAMLPIEPVHETEVIDLRHARMLIKEPKKACGYSRDGQQKLDEKELADKK